jgi:hypothetical protein
LGDTAHGGEPNAALNPGSLGIIVNTGLVNTDALYLDRLMSRLVVFIAGCIVLELPPASGVEMSM